MVPSFSAPLAGEFSESALVLRLYYMRYNKLANTAKLTSFARFFRANDVRPASWID